MNNNNQRSAFGAYQNPQQGLQNTQQGFQTAQQGLQNAQQGFQTTQGLQNTQQGYQSAQQGFQQGGFQTQGYLPQHVEKVNLPTRVVELPTAIHEQVRVEKVKEVQPIVNVERDFTQVIQKTQPIIDKEIRPVNIQQRNLETQVLPDIRKKGKENAVPRDFDTVQYMQPRALTVEKPTIYNEVDKTQVIEEIQPVIYKETIVPQITKETAPSFQKIVEGTVYSNERLSTVDLGVKGQKYVADRTVPSGITVSEQLPIQRVNVPTAVHEKIRQERVTEIQPVVNVERDFTQVIQKTQPLLDKEIRPVQIEERTLPTSMLPDVNRETGLGGMPRETSSVDYLQEKRAVIQKPTIYNEIDKTKIIEEIQPVIYKETIVPEVVKETQPSFQRIVEGTVYTSEVLPPVQLHGSNFSYPTQISREINPPVVTTQPVVIVEEKVVTKQMPLPPKPKKKAPQTRKIIEEKETYVTTVNEIIPNMKKI